MAQRSPRRGFLVGLLSAPAAFVGARALAAVTERAHVLRPGPWGRSTTRCAACGSSEHSMLDRRCPDAPEVV